MDQSVILVKRSQVYMDDDSSSYSSTCSAAASPLSSSLDEVSILKQTMPMIEARVSDRDLLIRIRCEKNKGCLVKILSSLEKFRLEVVNSFTLPFGNSTLVITILSKVIISYNILRLAYWFVPYINVIVLSFSPNIFADGQQIFSAYWRCCEEHKTCVSGIVFFITIMWISQRLKRVIWSPKSIRILVFLFLISSWIIKAEECMWYGMCLSVIAGFSGCVCV